MEGQGESVQKPAQSNYCVEVMAQLNVLRRQANFCDVKLVVEEKEFKAHRSVLSAASPFFNKMLTSDMKEKEQESVHLELLASVMEYVLDYIYTGDVQVIEANAHELITSANYLLLPGLKIRAGEFLAQNLDISNSIATYYFAEKYKCDELLQNSREFINCNFNSVSESEGFLALSHDQVKEWLSSDDIVISAEKDVFKTILKWVANDESGDRKSHFFELFTTARLTSVTRGYLFTNDILENGLVRGNPKCIDRAHSAMKRIAHASEESPPTKKPRKCLKMHVDVLVTVKENSIMCYVPSNKFGSFKLAGALSGIEKTRTFYTGINTTTTQVTSCRGCLYAVGEDTKFGNIAERYDPLVNSFSLIEKPPNMYRFVALAALQGLVYQIGGEHTSSGNEQVPVNDVCRYDPDSNSWQQVTPLSSHRSSVCAVADDKYIYAIGGYTETTCVDTVERFEPGSNTWAPLASMTESRAGACGVVLGGKIFVLGGTKEGNDGNRLSTCEMYICTMNQWQVIQGMDEPRCHASAAVFGDNIFVFGGNKMSYAQKLNYELYDLQKNEWEDKGNMQTNNGSFKACALRLSRTVLKSLSRK